MYDIKVEMFPAQEGDCFLVSLNTDPVTHILIDGGFESTYHEFLKPRLIELSNKGEYLTLVVVTHVDADHIEGILELFSENGSAENPQIIRIDEIWHNSYRHLQVEKEANLELGWREKEILQGIIANGNIKSKNKNNQNKDISANQGSSLAALIYKGNYKWNEKFEYKAVNSDMKNEIKIHQDVKLRILSPNSDKLDKLSTYWLRELRKQKYDFKLTDEEIFDDAYEFSLLRHNSLEEVEESKNIAFRNEEFRTLLTKKSSHDNSPANGSSIAFILEYKGKKLMFLGDSHSKVIYKEMKNLIEKSNYNNFFNMIKVSHHGSRRNTSKELLEIIDATHFLISTDGSKNDHPNKETLARIIGRVGEQKRLLIFNYPPLWEELYSHELRDKLNFDINYSDGKTTIVTEL